jgi:hypothetical protein
MEGDGPPPDGPPPGFDPEYSGQHPLGDGGPGGPPPGGMEGPPPTDKLTFLRGVQFTDAAGRVSFTTVFPGFYMGRTNHIHFKVRLGGQSGVAGWRRTYLAGHTSHIGRVFFPEEVTAALMKHEPYSKHAIQRTTIAEDGVYGGQHGDTSLAGLKFLEPGKPQAGMRAELVVAVDPTATPKPAQREGGPGGPPPRG